MLQERPRGKSSIENFGPKPGEEKTIEERIAVCLPEVLNMCRQLLRGNPGAETLAEDIAQETIMKAIKHADSFKGEAKLTTWLGTITRNVIASHFRTPKNKPQIHSSLEDVGETESNFSGEGDFVSAMDNERAVKKINLAVEKLRQEHRLDETEEAIFNLRYQEELQTSQIAERLRMTNQAVKSRLFRVREKIQKELELEGHKASDLKN